MKVAMHKVCVKIHTFEENYKLTRLLKAFEVIAMMLLVSLVVSGVISPEAWHLCLAFVVEIPVRAFDALLEWGVEEG